jgi:hypothetical protein
MGAHNRQTVESFLRRVQIGAHDECWPWLGATNNTGYGSVGWTGEVHSAHRVMGWLLGRVMTLAAPRDKRAADYILHKCDTRRCCNPHHWFIGTYSDNMIDMYAKRRHPIYRGSTHANAVFSAAEVDQARGLYAALGSFAAVARTMGRGETSVANLIKGRTYGVV